MKLLSVIIPIYNVEPYVEKCLLSLLVQDLPLDDYEIICINDGSTDNSKEVVLRLQREYSNIILIDQENEGVSVARNKGADKATGKYLLFVDSDDFVQENSLGLIIKDTCSNQAQIAIPGYTYLDSNGIVQGKRIYDGYEERIFNGMEAYYLLRDKKLRGEDPANVIIPDSSVGIIYEANFLNRNYLRYVPGVILNQDCEFLARVHCLSDRCLLLDHMFYAAVARKGSATRSELSEFKISNGYIFAANNLNKFKQSHFLNEKQKLFLNVPIIQLVLQAVYSGVRTRSVNKLRTIIKNLKLSGLSRLRLEGCKGKHLVCGKSYNTSPYLGAIVLVIYQKIVLWHNSFILTKKSQLKQSFSL